MAKDDKPTKAESEKSFREELTHQLVTLSTAGFGVVAALAWNQTIQTLVKDYIEPRIPGSGLFYQLVYALLITILAVLVTYQLSRLASKFQHKED